MSDRNQKVTTDPLANYSVRDLTTALHWTDKKELSEALGNPYDVE